jgi:hypothetical protein
VEEAKTAVLAVSMVGVGLLDVVDVVVVVVVDDVGRGAGEVEEGAEAGMITAGRRVERGG